MKLIILLLILSSCSSTFHLKKAIKKDPTILKERVITDTLKIETLDSIPYVVNDTIRYTYFKTTTDTLIQYKYKYIKNPKTRQEVRLELKNERVDSRLDKRLNQTKIRKEAKSGWQIWIFCVIMGFIFGVFFILLIKRQ